jgi:hypothetical protein
MRRDGSHVGRAFRHVRAHDAHVRTDRTLPGREGLDARFRPLPARERGGDPEVAPGLL